MKKIFVVNAGSTTLKFQLLEMPNGNVLASGNCERIGDAESFLVLKIDGQKTQTLEFFKDHDAAFKFVIRQLVERKVIKSEKEVDAVGHRVVHGGPKYTKSTIINEELVDYITEITPLAPNHNPGAIMGIKAARDIFKVPHVAVFDTAFHRTILDEYRLYAINKKIADELMIERYGFHGTSHKFISEETAKIMGTTNFKMINCHLGGGASVCAIENGKSVNTSMGLTPLPGLVMGTRCGDIDPMIPLYIQKQTGKSIDEVSAILTKKSGWEGLTGTSDCRAVEEMAAAGDKNAILALKMFANACKDYIGKYMAQMNGADIITFTAGIGENDSELRKMILDNMEFLGIKLNDASNDKYCLIKGHRGIGKISAEDSKVLVYMVPTNEELAIARETESLAFNAKLAKKK